MADMLFETFFITRGASPHFDIFSLLFIYFLRSVRKNPNAIAARYLAPGLIIGQRTHCPGIVRKP